MRHLLLFETRSGRWPVADPLLDEMLAAGTATRTVRFIDMGSALQALIRTKVCRRASYVSVVTLFIGLMI